MKQPKWRVQVYRADLVFLEAEIPAPSRKAAIRKAERMIDEENMDRFEYLETSEGAYEVSTIIPVEEKP